MSSMNFEANAILSYCDDGLKQVVVTKKLHLLFK